MTEYLPTINAFLNLTSSIFLVLGRIAIARKKVANHKIFMLTAFAFSTMFLCCYLFYHFGTEQVTTFQRQGAVRYLYYAILFTHIPLASLVVPTAVAALYFAFSRQYARHKGIVKWLFPLWVYVSVTGVLIYLFLYQLQ